MLYDSLFQRYGAPSKEAEIRVLGWLRRPDALDTFGSIEHADREAARLIAQLEGLAEALKEYRGDLVKRYGELATMPSTERLLLERVPSSGRGVMYYVHLFRDYEDGTTVCTSTERFEGRERHKAIARYEELRKQRPGIAAEKRIEKRQWER